VSLETALICIALYGWLVWLFSRNARLVPFVCGVLLVAIFALGLPLAAQGDGLVGLIAVAGSGSWAAIAVFLRYRIST
jgi:hypothetical protein